MRVDVDAGALPDSSVEEYDASEAGVDAAAPSPYDFTISCAATPCATQIAARGGQHACALLQGGSVRCWGSNHSGQLGTGGDDDDPTSTFVATPRPAGGVSNATSVAAAGRGRSGTTCVVAGTGDVSCFGSNASGQLGQASGPSVGAHPEPVTIDGVSAKSITLTSTFALAVGKDDRVWSWGNNDAFQLGRSAPAADASASPGPAQADGVSAPVVACASTLRNGFALLGSGKVASWGGGGVDDALGRASSMAVDPIAKTIALADVSALAAGDAHACALIGGSVHCWGKNDHGQLGTGNRADESLPARVLFSDDVHVVAIAAGGRSSCAIASNGGVYCWGANEGGQSGVASARDQRVPARIVGLTADAVQIALMDDAACALLRDGTVSCWGKNLSGQLGRGGRDEEIHLNPAAVVFQ